jgi:hypothetical protein
MKPMKPALWNWIPQPTAPCVAVTLLMGMRLNRVELEYITKNSHQSGIKEYAASML